MKTSLTNSIISKIIIIMLLVGCLFKMPYGYYQFMRIAVCGLFIWLAYLEYKHKIILTVILCCLSAILFNPIAKLSFHKKDWQTIDKGYIIVLAIWLIVDFILFIKGRKSNKAKSDEKTKQ